MGVREYPSWLYNQSGVIPWRRCDGGIEILLITSIRRGRWIIPKGVVEPDMTPGESARKEAFEEGGIDGVLSGFSMGSYRYRKWGGICTVEVYILRVTHIFDEWPESDQRKRQWFPLETAAELIEEPTLKTMIHNLSKL